MVALTLASIAPGPDPAPESEGASQTRDPAAKRSTAPGDRAAANAHAAAARGDRIRAAQAHQERAYRTDQVLVALHPRADVRGLARAHGVEVLRAPGAGGYAALAVPAHRSIDELMADLRADDAVRSVLPNGVVRGAADAASLQEDADKDAADAAKRLAEAEEAEETLQALIDAGASDKQIGDAEEDPARARREAADAIQAQAKADKRVDLEYRAKVREAQIHMKTVNHPKWEEPIEKWDEMLEPDYSRFTVAVLDTGVAYTDAVDSKGVRHAAASSLATNPISAPCDFVNDDPHPGDDHQHGTHIASIIGSDGALVGLAPGVGLMPVKVLDETNAGTALTLVEGIHHAVDHGADVINMSVSFAAGYVPSPLLLDALERAHAAGIVMVAAAGNAGEPVATWPAASPRVIAVTSATINDHSRHVEAALYSNQSTQVDLTAPGGAIGQDRDGDGFDDGILAETINPGDPGSTGYWFYAGTSQAAAVVSGAIVRMMATGIPASDAIRGLQFASDDGLDGDPYFSGWGSGTVDLERGEKLATNSGDLEKIQHTGDLHVAVHPFLISKHDGEEIEAHALFTVVDDRGQPVKDLTVIGRVSGAQAELFDCKTDGDGICEVKLHAVETMNDDGDAFDPGLAWVWEVDGLIDGEDVVTRPTALLYASDYLEAVAATVGRDAELAPAALAVYWPEGEDDELGDMAEQYIVLTGGAGIPTSPFGVSFTPALLDGVATVAEVSLDLDGSGISTSPFGMLPGRVVTFDGSGISTSPFGFTLPPLLALDGSGISTSPFGFHPIGLTQPFEGSGISTSPFGYQNNPILLSSGTILGASAQGALASRLADGGWMGQDGYGVGQLVLASGLIDGAVGGGDLMGSSTQGSSAGAGHVATPYELDAQPLPLQAILPVE